jgi:hypothetical protein
MGIKVLEEIPVSIFGVYSENRESKFVWNGSTHISQ